MSNIEPCPQCKEHYEKGLRDGMLQGNEAIRKLYESDCRPPSMIVNCENILGCKNFKKGGES